MQGIRTVPGFTRRLLGPLVASAWLATSACSTTYNPGGSGTAPVVDPLPHTALTDGSVGSACGTCQDGLSCFTSAPSGYCTKSCVDALECGQNALCLDDQGAMYCFRACTKDNQCREGYTCQGATGSTVCLPAAS